MERLKAWVNIKRTNELILGGMERKTITDALLNYSFFRAGSYTESQGLKLPVSLIQCTTPPVWRGGVGQDCVES